MSNEKLEKFGQLKNTEKVDKMVDIDINPEGLSEMLDFLDEESEESANKFSEKKSSYKDPKKVKNKKKINIRSGVVKPRPLPSKNVMISRVKGVLEQEKKNLHKFASSPLKYSEQVKKIRQMQGLVSSLISASMEFIKEVYLKYFGSRHGIGNSEDKT